MSKLNRSNNKIINPLDRVGVKQPIDEMSANITHFYSCVQRVHARSVSLNVILMLQREDFNYLETHVVPPLEYDDTHIIRI
jgi:hypothetical protein